MFVICIYHRVHVCIYVPGAGMLQCTCGSQFLESVLLSTSCWLQGIELRSPDLPRKSLCWLSHLTVSLMQPQLFQWARYVSEWQDAWFIGFPFCSGRVSNQKAGYCQPGYKLSQWRFSCLNSHTLFELDVFNQRGHIGCSQRRRLWGSGGCEQQSQLLSAHWLFPLN